MVYREIYGDLFQVDKKYYLAHCISADFALGKGIMCILHMYLIV